MIRAPIILFVLTQALNAQPCSIFTRTDSTLLSVNGLIDHNELDPSWLKEQIPIDSIDTWCRKQATEYAKYFTGAMPDSLKEFEELYSKSLHRLEEEFLKLLHLLKPGDSIWYYSTPKLYWDSLAGQDGVLLLRDCTVVGQLIFMQS